MAFNKLSSEAINMVTCSVVAKLRHSDFVSFVCFFAKSMLALFLLILIDW